MNNIGKRKIIYQVEAPVISKLINPRTKLKM